MYDAYLTRRIRPAAMLLIDENEPELLTLLLDRYPVSGTVVDHLLVYAREKKKTAAWRGLLLIKDRKFGFLP